MTHIIHHSKLYTSQYYISCFIFGVVAEWAESLYIWLRLPFQISLNEVLSLNVFALILGGITGIFVGLLGKFFHNIVSRKLKFAHKTHQTSWTFALAVMFYALFMIIGGLLTKSILSRAISVILISPLLFFLVYQFSVRVLFRKRMAGRTGLEIILALFLLIYFLKHPGLSKEVPLTVPYHPHIFIFNIPDLPPGDEGMKDLSACYPTDRSNELINFIWTFPTSENDSVNEVELLTLKSQNRNTNLLTVLGDYQYHRGLFSARKMPSYLAFKQYDIIDDQTYSLKPQLRLFKFYDGIFFLRRLSRLVSTMDGFPLGGIRDPMKLNNRLIEWIVRERDDKAFFVYLNYLPIPQSSEAVGNPSYTALQSLLSFLNKTGILKNSVLFFTSISGIDTRRPLIAYLGDAYPGEIVSDRAITQKDLPATIFSLLKNGNDDDKFSADLTAILRKEISNRRPIYIWSKTYDSSQPADLVCCYPWLLERMDNTKFTLKNISDKLWFDIDLSLKYPEITSFLRNLIEHPVPSIPDTNVLTQIHK